MTRLVRPGPFRILPLLALGAAVVDQATAVPREWLTARLVETNVRRLTSWTGRRAAVAPEGRAREVLRAAVDALGGAARLDALKQWVVEGRGRENSAAEMQGVRVDEPAWRPHREKLAADLQTLTVGWDRRTLRNDGSERWRRMIFGAETFGVVDWRADFGAVRKRSHPEAHRRALARRIPHLLLAEALAGAQGLRAAERPFRGRTLDAVEVDLPGAATLTLLISRSPALLERVEYRAHLPGRGDVTVGWEWTGWSRHRELGYAPRGHRVDVDGVPSQELEYSLYSASQPAMVADLLEVPARFLSDARPRPAPAAASHVALPATGAVAPGVVVERVGGFLVMFVEFRDFVAAFEAPEVHPGFDVIPVAAPPSRLAAEGLVRIRAVFPGKPVRYVVISHHHSDHMGGLREFAAAGATLVVARADRAAASRLLRAPHTVAPDGWRAEGREAVIQAVAPGRPYTIGDGTRTLEVINVGKNPHTAENLLVWLPRERILMQGDLFYYDEGARFPPMGREIMNRFFAGWLRDHALEPRAIYGVHNEGAAGPEWLSRAWEAAP